MTENQIKILLENIGKISLRKISYLPEINLPIIMLRNKLFELGIPEPNCKFSMEQTKFVLDNYKKFTVNDIANAIGKKKREVMNYLYAFGIKKEKGLLPISRRTPYRIIAYIKANYPQRSCKEIAREFDLPEVKVMRVIKKLIAKGEIQRRKKTAPAKGSAFYRNRKANKTSYQKGTTHRAHPIFHEKTWKNGNVLVKVSVNEWVTKSRFIYESHHGKGSIPEGYVVSFKDRNNQNYSIDNLEVISRKENLLRNKNPLKTSISLREYHKKRKLRERLGLTA